MNVKFIVKTCVLGVYACTVDNVRISSYYTPAEGPSATNGVEITLFNLLLTEIRAKVSNQTLLTTTNDNKLTNVPRTNKPQLFCYLAISSLSSRFCPTLPEWSSVDCATKK